METNFRLTCAVMAWADATANLAIGGLRVRRCHSLIFDPPLATKVCCPALWSLGPTAHFGKSYNQVAANASIFQESKQTKESRDHSSTSPKREGVCCDTMLLHFWSTNLHCTGSHKPLLFGDRGNKNRIKDSGFPFMRDQKHIQTG